MPARSLGPVCDDDLTAAAFSISYALKFSATTTTFFWREVFINGYLESSTVASAVINFATRAMIPRLRPQANLGYTVRSGPYPRLPSLQLRFIVNSNGESEFAVRARVLSVSLHVHQGFRVLAFGRQYVVVRAQTLLFKLHHSRPSKYCAYFRKLFADDADSTLIQGGVVDGFQSIACRPTSQHTPSSSS